MARPIRVEFEGAVYHVTARGNDRKPIYRDDRDRERFLETLHETVERFGFVIRAYCLMPNHFHLLALTPCANLSDAAGWLQTTCRIRFNRRHRRSGHLYQARFKAQLVEVAEDYGYRDGSGVHRVLQRLEEKAQHDRSLARRLKKLAEQMSSVKS